MPITRQELHSSLDAEIEKIGILSQDLTNHKNDEDPHPQYAADTEIQTINNQISNLLQDLSTHSADKNNPHRVTAVQAGALPNTGGSITGSLEINIPESGTSTLLNIVSQYGKFRLVSTNGSDHIQANQAMTLSGYAGAESPGIDLKTANATVKGNKIWDAGNQPKITVGTTAPSNSKENDIWVEV